MSVITTVQVIGILSSGLKAGALLGDRAGARFARPTLSPGSFVTFQQEQMRHWEKLMPVLSSVALLSSVAWLAMLRSDIASMRFMAVAVAVAANVASMALAVMGCLPINRKLMKWSAAAPPPDVMATWARWERVNDMRTILALLAFVVLMLAFATS